MKVRVTGGVLDGRELDQDKPQPTIHQTGLVLLRVHRPYPKRRGENVVERLLVYTEDYALHHTDDGPVYRCVAPFGGVSVGDAVVAPAADGAVDVYADAAGRLWPTPDRRERKEGER